MFTKWSLLFCSLILVACGHVGTRKNSDQVVKEDTTVVRSENIQAAMAEISSEYGHVDVVENKHVSRWINYFTGRGRKHMRRYLERSTRYLTLMREVLHEEGLPEDLVFLPIVESGFSSSAHSFASAVGYWQFIRATGKRYNLRIDPYIDERSDPVESTRAAAKYLKALYNLFGDWYLSLAAYNTGENRVKRLVMKYGTRDYWQLAKRRRLPRETRSYVPKYLAAVIIAKNPTKYGFTDVDYMPKLSYDSIPVFKPISLEKLARNLGQNYKEFKRLNPKFRSDYVPVKAGEAMYVRVPKGYAKRAVASLDASFAKAPSHIPNDIFYYRIRRGDTLSGIAQKYRTRISTLRRLNRLGRRSFIRIGQRLKVPDRGNNVLRRHQRRVARQTAGKGSSNYSYHTVRRGENLSLISKKYGVSVTRLLRLNRLSKRSLLRVGQKLKLKSAPAKKKAKATGTGTAMYHKVKSGENLSLIARKYGVILSQLKSWNQMGRRSLLKVGQKIRVKAGLSSLVHVVRRGENLSTIAEKYQVSIASIASKNSLRNKSRIAIGKKLVIPK